MGQKQQKKYKAQQDIHLTALADVYISNIDVRVAGKRLVELKRLCREMRIMPMPKSMTEETANPQYYIFEHLPVQVSSVYIHTNDSVPSTLDYH